ncbi:MAG: DUF4402 domain-containing protein [Rhodothermaceae bacterium]|nr:DUF4402 domain-containing protein [Rhodothermaceae bacterium]
MTRILPLVLLCVPVPRSAAQLVVHRPLILHQHSGPALIESAFSPEAHAWYDAVIQGSPLRMGGHTLAWEPHLSCGHSSGNVAGRTCRSQASGVLFWSLSGVVSQKQHKAPGIYQGYAILTVRGPTSTYSTSIPVTYEVHADKVSCAVSATRKLDFGEAEAYRPGSVTLSSITGGRSYKGSQQYGRGVSTYAPAALTLTTSAGSAMVTVLAPATLSSSTGTIGFTSQLAYQTIPGGRYVPLIEGSGSRRIAVNGGRMGFRIGGTVSTDAASAEAHYQGNITVTFLCGQS